MKIILYIFSIIHYLFIHGYFTVVIVDKYVNKNLYLLISVLNILYMIVCYNPYLLSVSILYTC